MVEITSEEQNKVKRTEDHLRDFWDPYNSNVGVLDIVPEVSETILSSFHSFYFILLFRTYLHHFIFQLTDPFFCFRYSAIDSFQSFLILVIVLFISVCLFFNSSRSLLIDSYIFSILFSRFLIIFTSIILNSFSDSLPISPFIYLDFCVSSLFLHCVVFLCLFIILFLILLCLRSPFPRFPWWFSQ